MTELDAAIFPVITNWLQSLVELPIPVFVVFALRIILSPTFANVTVVVPTMKSLQVEPSVVYSNETDGAEPLVFMATVELASSAVNVRP